MPVLVIGNGESRKNLDLNIFKNHFTIVGCNALHRDMEVDHLICCDRRMVEEASAGINTANTKIYVRPDWFRYYRKIQKDKRINQVPDLIYEGNLKQDNPVHWGSGPYAVLVAAGLDSSEVRMIGFDLYPVNEKLNNVYKDTKNYGKKDANPIDYNFWIYQIGKVFQHHPNKNFIIMNDHNWKMPNLWKHPNVSFEVLATKNLTLA